MEAHKFLSKKGFDVHSFGTNGHVKIPGPSASQPNIYSFETTYDEMYQDLVDKDKLLYAIGYFVNCYVMFNCHAFLVTHRMGCYTCWREIRGSSQNQSGFKMIAPCLI
jgi:hypothetical protein